MKKIVALMISLVLIFSCTGVFAQDSVSVLLDGRELSFDVEPQIINSRTMVPMRVIFNALSSNVDWVKEHKLIIATKGTSIITMMIDQPIMHIGNLENNEQKVIELDSPPVIIDGRTLVPVRAISDALGVKVDWNKETRTVVLSTGKEIIGEGYNEK